MEIEALRRYLPGWKKEKAARSGMKLEGRSSQE